MSDTETTIRFESPRHRIRRHSNFLRLEALESDPAHDEALTMTLASLGWLDPGPPSLNLPEWLATLADAIRAARQGRPIPDGVITGDELLVFGRGLDWASRRGTLRRFVSRLDWRRLCAYAPITWSEDDDYELLGDYQPEILRELNSLPPVPNDSPLVCRWRNSRWETDYGESFLPDHLRQVHPRLSLTEISEIANVGLGTDGSNKTWIAVGLFARPNTAFLPDPFRRTAEDRWCVGVSSSLDEAVTKARAEGVERFALGDYRTDELRQATASELGDSALDPRPLLGYSTRQRTAHGLTEFDPSSSDWWVKGETGGGELRWLPAALVFSPFAVAPSWLHPGYASSNGAAAHPDRGVSQLRAWLELNERDAFLRTYFSRQPPRQFIRSGLTADLRSILASLEGAGTHDRACFVEMISSVGVVVHGCVVRRGDRLVIGASAQVDGLDALQKAAYEAAVQLHFAIEDGAILPEEVRTPQDHSRLYTTTVATDRASWLLDGHACREAPSTQIRIDRLIRSANFYSVEVGGLFVSRAVDSRLVPMVFGYDTLPEENDVLLSCAGGPIDPFPHPFA